jgi:hypothetical protein
MSFHSPKVRQVLLFAPRLLSYLELVGKFGRLFARAGHPMPAGSLTVLATGVTLAGATITPPGVWSRNLPYSQTTSGNTVSVYVPPASAVLVCVLH